MFVVALAGAALGGPISEARAMWVRAPLTAPAVVEPSRAGSSEPPPPAAAVGAPEPGAPITAPGKDPWPPALDGPVRRVLGSGCRDGLSELRALAASRGPGFEIAAEIVRLCGQAGAHFPPARLVEVPEPAPPLRDRGGRAQLVLATTLYGIWAGIAVDVLGDIDGDRTPVLAPLLGMAAGLGGSLYATRGGNITAGQAWSVITGLDYGTYNGLLWAAARDARTDKGVIGTALGAGLAGGALGILVAVQRPPQGAVEMVRSGGLYGTAAAFMGALLFASDSPSSKAIFTTLATGMDVGLAGGAALASRVAISRNRMLLIDAGTVAGLGFGLGTAWLVAGSGGNGRHALGAGGLVGLGVGMATAILLTRRRDDAHEAEGTAPAASALAARDEHGHWSFGGFTLVPVPAPDGAPRRGLVGAVMPLAAGRL
jgi:hypothetical protein